MKTIYVATVVICMYIIFMTELVRVEQKTHWMLKNCELAEISPDFTPKEKQDCRQARKDRT